MSIDLDLEEEIRLELERLEQIFNDETGCVLDGTPPRVKPNRVSYSAYEYAEAEGEKEELEDKLNLLLSKTEDFSAQLERMNCLNVDLQSRCTQFQLENVRLKEQIGLINVPLESGQMCGEVKGGDGHLDGSSGKQEVCGAISAASSIALEHLLVEERRKVTQLETALRDMMLIKDSALLELERERGLRIHAGIELIAFGSCVINIHVWYCIHFTEKERDAYSAAYEASLQHFEKWTKSKS